MSIQIAITPPAGGINMDKLRAELVAVYADVTGVSSAKGIYYATLIADSLVTQQQLQVIVDVHNAAILTTEQQETAQASSAQANLKTLMTGLHGLSAQDKGYALYCRLMAVGDGASNQVIMGIIDRPTAVAYVTAKPEWVAATAATRNLLADVLEADARLCQVLLLVLT